jgi:quinolinate synthase
MGIFYELGQKNPEKKFYSVGHRQFCPNMKRITVEKVIKALENMEPAVKVDEIIAQKASIPLQKMMEFAQ